MNPLSLIMSLALSSGLAVQSDESEIQDKLVQHAVSVEEGQQYVQLALSLRNQKLLEQQAESLARQYQFRLQAAQAATALRNLEPDGTQSLTVVNPLKDYTLRALVLHQDALEARLSVDQRIVTARDNQRFENGVLVSVRSDHVLLSLGNQRRRLEISH